MSGQAGSFEQLARMVGEALAPLKDRLAAGQRRAALPRARAPPAAGRARPGRACRRRCTATANGAAALPGKIADLVAAIQADNGVQITIAGVALGTTIAPVVQGISQIGSALNGDRRRARRAQRGAARARPAIRRRAARAAGHLPAPRMARRARAGATQVAGARRSRRPDRGRRRSRRFDQAALRPPRHPARPARPAPQRSGRLPRERSTASARRASTASSCSAASRRWSTGRAPRRC